MDSRISVVQGDLTKISVDAIVNAANTSLLGGGGVDGAIHRIGGPDILNDCLAIRARQGGCPTGEAVITTAGKLPARKVIHTVGPVWQGGDKKEADLLANCYRNALQLAVENGLTSIAFPNISTGVYRYPKAAACHIALKTTQLFLEKNTTLDQVLFVCFDEENYAWYEKNIGSF